MNKLIAMLVVALMVSAAMATVPSASVRYIVDRDTSVYASGQAHVNAGLRDSTRAGKASGSDGEQPLHDWDMVAIQADIDVELTMWGKTLAQAMAVDMVTVRTEIVNPDLDGQDWPGKIVHVRGVLSVNDWHEGDGYDWDTNYDWTTPYGATWMYAGDTVPFSSGAIEWLAPGGTPGANIAFNQLCFTVNSASINGIYATSDNNGTPGVQEDELVWNGADLDEALWSELIYDDNCVGLNQYGDGWWPGLDGNGDPVDPTRPTNDDNVLMCELGQWGGIAAASLVIEVKPHDGDAQPDGFVDLLDLTIVANNWELNPGANQWEQADFNSDGNVDLLDLTLLANEWEWQASGGAAAVPEPASLVIIGLGALALIRRRR